MNAGVVAPIGGSSGDMGYTFVGDVSRKLQETLDSNDMSEE